MIAIENVRLFKELDERTKELTRSVGELKALGEVGQAVSSSLDLETVLKDRLPRGPSDGHRRRSDLRIRRASEEFHLRATDQMEEELSTRCEQSIRLGEGAGPGGDDSCAGADPRHPGRTRIRAARVRQLLKRFGYPSLAGGAVASRAADHGRI